MVTLSLCWAAFDGEAQCHAWLNNTTPDTHPNTFWHHTRVPNDIRSGFLSHILPGSSYVPHRTPWSTPARASGSLARRPPMWGSRCRNTPYRFPGNPRTRSKRPWCHSPCRRGSCSRRPGLRCSSNSSRPRMCTRHTRPVRQPCCTVSGTHRTGRPRCSGRNSLGQCQRSHEIKN